MMVTVMWCMLIGGGVDYDSSLDIVTFPAGVTSVTQSVPVIVDTDFEGTEDFNLVLTILQDASRLRVSAGDQNRAIGEIVDERKKYVFFVILVVVLGGIAFYKFGTVF